MCCCKNILDFCSVGTCEESVIDFGIKALHEGTHKLVTTFKGVEFTIEKDFLVDDKLTFPTGALNENYEFQCQLYDPEGTQILINKDGIEYDCFQFTTKISYAI